MEIEEIKKINLGPNDYLIITVPDHTPINKMARMANTLKNVFGKANHRVFLANFKTKIEIVDDSSSIPQPSECELDEWGRDSKNLL